MDLQRKIEIVETAVRSVSEHSDHDSVVLLAALDRIAVIVEREKAAVAKRQQLALNAALNGS
jgi:hypothetical protein